MSALDWGPIEELAARLSSIESLNDPSATGWARVVTSTGGLWNTYAVNEGAALWPAQLRPVWSLPPRPLPPVESGWSRLAKFFRNLFARGRNAASLRKQRRNRQAQSRDLTTILAECHAWLGQKNMLATTRWFSPFWRDLPFPLMEVSSQGILWALAAYTFYTWGPRALAEMGSLFTIAGSDATTADCLVLHIHLDAIIQSLPSRLNIPLHGLSARRRMGGLRSDRFIRSYLTLSQAELKTDVHEWFTGLQQLVHHSGLTQLIYLDIIQNPPNRDVAERDSLFAAVTTGGAAKDETSQRQQWRELWLSHLARSMLGACLSPTPAFEAGLRAERMLEAARQEARVKLMEKFRKIGPPTAQDVESYPEVAKARQELATQRQTMRMQYLTRLEIVNGWLSSSVYLKLHFLNMLVRHMAAATTESMLQRWQTIKLEVPRPAPRDRFLWAEKDRVCFAAFEKLLYGPAAEDARPSTPPDYMHERLRAALLEFVSVSAPDFSNMERESGVPNQSLNSLFNRFQNNGVLLPFPEERSGSPADILGDWIDALLDNLTAQTVTNQSSTVVSQRAI